MNPKRSKRRVRALYIGKALEQDTTPEDLDEEARRQAIEEGIGRLEWTVDKQVTVKELIEYLRKLKPDTLVAVDIFSAYVPVRDIGEVMVEADGRLVIVASR